AETEQFDPSDSVARCLGERLERGRHTELQGAEIDVWIRRFEVQAGWNLPMLQHQQRLDQARHGRGGFQVAEIRLDGPNDQRRLLRALPAECLSQCVCLDRVADCGTGPMSL